MLVSTIVTAHTLPDGKAKRITAIFEDDIVFTAKPAKKEAIFGSGERIVYDVELKNNTNNDQKGNVGYTIYSWKDQVLKQDSVHVKLDKNGKKSISLRMPSQSAGMYKLNITVNVTDYDDTIRRVFAVDPKKIKSDFAKPGDFDGFWQTTIDTLARTPMQAKVTLQPSMERDGISCYLVELHSYGNVVIRGWLTIPKEHKIKDKLAVWLVLPGYGPRGVKPIYGTSDLAVLAINVRGVGNSRDRINPTEEAYVSVGVESKWKYIYRGVIMDCMRAVDYIASRPDFDQDNILCSGASMGGYLSIAVSSLDKRIKLCSANNPVFCDYRSLVGSKEWPMKSFVKYGRERRVGLDRILNTLDYYDLKNFAPNLQCKALIGIGLLDNLAPAYNEYVMLGNLKNNYKLFVYPELAHEVPPEIYSYLSKWMMDQFGLF
ncbi:acetylxylan esterase [Mucilaginibacter sp. KACC 22063]|uniref:acetylxylan esterase n=1 Tax=Mucilaginibacter sp. KACC 22063 TaxID=3025666 RepID=UPI00236545D4|nr:acetylxylan esterase [Mucilaginibacter sp. KACC 22063]WDF56353.1 acetylxylan esterase [Mucilaginibacter sp. KACC 22063]